MTVPAQVSRFSLLAALFMTGLVSGAAAQGLAGTNVHGNFQFDGQYYVKDSVIGADVPPEKFLNNGFANFNYESTNFLAGLRYESYLNPINGYDPLYKGSGIPYRYLTYRNDKLEVTAGNYYDQFGSGLVFRSYEERSLGIDNAMDGFRLVFRPASGITLKGVIGRQRYFFSHGEGIVRGGDGEVSLNDALPSWKEKKTQVIFGASFISKFQADDNPDYILPENVGCGGGRLRLTRGNWNLYTEYAYKINDPSADNGYIYKSGQAMIMTLGYTKKGLGATLTGHRYDNMSFRSERDATGNNLNINYLPAQTKNHTSLLPSIYPYATQANGEIGYQAELFFNIKSGTPLGGQYGTDININYSRIYEIDRTNLNDSMGYDSDFFKFGEDIFFEDFNLEISRKWSKTVRTNITYIYLNDDKLRVEKGEIGKPHVYSHIGMLETIWKLASKKTLRTELQHLYTKQDQQSWAVVLAEYTIAPKWSFAAFDEYNYGNTHTDANGHYDQRIHYMTGTIAYTHNASRFSLGWGRQRAGILCVGGVCRSVPASTGVNFSVTSTF
jgi:hypothetical protein